MTNLDMIEVYQNRARLFREIAEISHDEHTRIICINLASYFTELTDQLLTKKLAEMEEQGIPPL